MHYSIRPAQPNDSVRLSRIAISSKAYWGYSNEFMLATKAELEVSEARLRDSDFNYQCLWLNGQHLVAFYALSLLPELSEFPSYQLEHPPAEPDKRRFLPGKTAELEGLFVAPKYIGKGLGQVLFAHACEALRCQGMAVLLIQSDPNALPFYLKQGGRLIGSKESGSIQGRHLPLVRFEIV
ncbi:GNAT family N-acetyltransferase [Aliiglaciecola litoralis]|uniref:N-acetyltransferase domain-containing protein n=1 Tax=Aliiglaciecola litoralis TaxID=582857 RepID=A0ABP3WUT4_9ALTE